MLRKCKKCRVASHSTAKRCHNCQTPFADEETTQRSGLQVVKAEGQGEQGEEPVSTQKASNGFHRLGRLFRDVALRDMCDDAARRVEIGHPAEAMAEDVANVVEAIQSPEGQKLFDAAKSILTKFAGK